MRVTFFFEIFKFFERLEKHSKISEKVFGFWDNYICIGCGKISVLWGEKLSLVIIVSINSPQFWQLIKREVFQLNLPKSDEKIG